MESIRYKEASSIKQTPNMASRGHNNTLTKNPQTTSKKTLINSASNRTLFNTNKSATGLAKNESQQSLKYVSSNPYLNVQNQKEAIANSVPASRGDLQKVFSKLSNDKKAYLTRLLEAQSG